MTYCLLVENTAAELQKAVNTLLGQGWDLYGITFVTAKDSYGNDAFCQALVKCGS